MPGWELSLISPIDRMLDGSLLTYLESLDREQDVAAIPMGSAGPHAKRVAGDLFAISKRTDDRIVLKGDLSKLHGIASKWTNRPLLVEGSVGSYFGSQLRGGQVELRGNASAFAGYGMRNGTIVIDGNVGDFVGGALPGKRSGMCGGRITISGHAGHHAGHRMRRGTMVIRGNCSDSLASDMVAGTIVVQGDSGRHVGVGMRRGTIILGKSAKLDPFRFSPRRVQSLSIMQLVANDLQCDAPEIGDALRRSVARYLGDRSAGGQGEIWSIDL